MKQNKIIISDIQRFCMHDGPGIRTTIFFKGCPLDCSWCHNPETKKITRQVMFNNLKCIRCGACQKVCNNNAQIVNDTRIFNHALCKACGNCIDVCPSKALTMIGNEMDVSKIIDNVKKDLAFYGNNGGITISGGEPTFQKDGLLELLKEAKKENISTCIETCGMTDIATLNEIIPYVDIFLYDVKDTNPVRLKKNTKADYQTIISNLKYLDSKGSKSILRCIMILNENMDDDHLNNLVKLYKELNNCSYLELLPYHPYGTSKADQLGIKDTIIYDIPTTNDLLEFANKLKSNGVIVKLKSDII